jgi:hypothetical protein
MKIANEEYEWTAEDEALFHKLQAEWIKKEEEEVQNAKNELAAVLREKPNLLDPSLPFPRHTINVLLSCIDDELRAALIAWCEEGR